SVEAKLGEDAADDIELHPFTRRRPSPADETKMIRQSNGADGRVFASRIANGPERAAQKARERMGFFRIGDQGTEDLVVWKQHDACRLSLVNACPAPRRIVWRLGSPDCANKNIANPHAIEI